ncbi:endo alpha-1,4 polygalactosaminidase [uncultured Jatrophihabitans sp.]|uniref:endo alpha-1,4 polygalactosaminidase n=1 Tax=uncultured Jatrophihabitans sp. TaxID=1610747 RepID=UPI0035CC83BF
MTSARARMLAAGLALVLLAGGCSSSGTGADEPTRSASSSVDAATVSGRATAHRVRLPPAGGVFDYQLGGAYPPRADVRIVDRDRTATPARGVYSVCYVNAFQTQPEENGWWRAHHRSLLLRSGGRYVQDPDWPGEYILDTSTPAKRTALLAIVGRWFDGCARAGFSAVEPDNLDSWTRKGVHGAITRADDVAFARALVARAHARGLAVAQKNAADLTTARIGFDFAVVEECEVYRECGTYTAHYGRRVIEIEYIDNGRAAFARACKARGRSISVILRDRDVVPRGDRDYYYRHC